MRPPGEMNRGEPQHNHSLAVRDGLRALLVRMRKLALGAIRHRGERQGLSSTLPVCATRHRVEDGSFPPDVAVLLT